MSEECALGCGKPVNPHDISTWKEVRGWVGGPRKDSMRLREDTGRYAHDHCVAQMQKGQAPDQQQLFESPTLWEHTPNEEAFKESEIKAVEEFLDE